MRREDAGAIIKRYALPSRALSKLALEAVASGTIDRCAEIPEQYRERLKSLEAAYKAKANEMGGKVNPRNLPLYLILKERYSSFSVRETADQLQMECYFRGIKPNMLSLFLDLIPADQLKTTPRPLLPTSAGKQHVGACLRVFEREDVDALDDANFAKVIDWIEGGRNGATVMIVSPVCPDYAAQKTEGGGFRYTFDGLNGGIGLAGRRLYKSIPSIHALLGRLQVRNFKHVVCMADYEGFSEDNLRRMQMTAQKFEEKITESVLSLEQQAPERLEVRLVSELCDGRSGWQQEISEMRQRFGRGEFNGMLDKKVIQDIAEQRRSLYRRWFGKRQVQSSSLEAMVIYQLAEYAAVGKLMAAKLCNPMIVSAGNTRLARFYSAVCDLPVLNLRAEHL